MKFLMLLLVSLSTVHISMAAETNFHEFKVSDIEGNPVNLADYKGQVVLIVNTASQCGFTRQYADLVQLQSDFEGKPFKVLGFPANNFGNQEPGSNQDIAQFCQDKFDVNFPMFSKISVRGDDASPLFQYLTSADNPDFTGNIRWNFEKILVGPDGIVRRRFRSMTSPNSPTIRTAIQSMLE